MSRGREPLAVSTLVYYRRRVVVKPSCPVQGRHPDRLVLQSRLVACIFRMLGPNTRWGAIVLVRLTGCN